MKDTWDAGTLRAFYEDHLKRVLLPFWLRSTDEKYGGFFNCYDNLGEQLVSTDKYTWSQGRFVWMYAKLASMSTDTFDSGERDRFLELARGGAKFLMDHCVLESGNCAFVMDRAGVPKLNPPNERYDSSIFADCFVVAGLAKYAAVSGDSVSLRFAWTLYRSVIRRIESGSYEMAPYPTPDGYRSHNIPMILLNVTQELLEAEEALGAAGPTNGADGSGKTEWLRGKMTAFLLDIMGHFVDRDGVLNEMIAADGSRVDSLLGRYCNPGHSIEDMWFVIHAAEKLGLEPYIGRAVRTAKKMVELGWDDQYGGLLLFADRDGGQPRGDCSGLEHEAMVGQIGQNWDNKLWWVHSEALYTTMLGYSLTRDERLLADYRAIHEYTFRTFPHPDERIGEWIQIRRRNGEPISKVVALPVKDPYHIIRNVTLIIELLERMEKGIRTEALQS
ncbi:N-acylglucosamine 2-epimerase [Paenibacillus hemerocallicola]|uniref:N-acylglucosamine 2-epimerase n=1 Tax=Paenibacillus hemerocallicola TaxID=1172614 RepID=A0A5C4T5M5_9BACL|nr:AGE family epimerase/isomerase [Paenibacillus hemerocallicola]TNJ64384.1 N-acylglucosamine 2-epimerase [Paenibacillus hemerocallicola]